MPQRSRSLIGPTAALFATATAASIAMSAPASAATRTPSVANLVARCTTQHAAPATSPRAAMFTQLQCIRRTAGLHAFAQSTAIAGVAKRWSTTMATQVGLNHNPNLASQMGAADTRWSTAGEVIGFSSAGNEQVSRVVAAWLRSPHHRALLLDPSLKVIGIGLTNGGGLMWATVDLADR